MLKWSPTNPDDMPFIDLLKSSFNHDLQQPQNEMTLRNSLSELWIQMYAKAESQFFLRNDSWMTSREVRFREILDYIRTHYADAIDVPQIASAVGISERDCYRTIKACAGTTPAAYLRAYRITRACHALDAHHANDTDDRSPMRLCNGEPPWAGIQGTNRLHPLSVSSHEAEFRYYKGRNTLALPISPVPHYQTDERKECHETIQPCRV